MVDEGEEAVVMVVEDTEAVTAEEVTTTGTEVTGILIVGIGVVQDVETVADSGEIGMVEVEAVEEEAS